MRPTEHIERAWRLWAASLNPWIDLPSSAQGAKESPVLVHRSEARVEPPKGWLARWFDRMEARAWEREARVRDAYFAEATDLADLEERMRRYDRMVATGRPLHRYM